MTYTPLTPAQVADAERVLSNLKTEETRILRGIEISEKLQKLRATDEYKDVFDEFYLKEEVVRNAMLMAEIHFMDADQRQSLQDSIVGQAQFNDWVNATTSMDALSQGRLQETRDKVVQYNGYITAGVPNEPVEQPTSDEQEMLPPEGELDG